MVGPQSGQSCGCSQRRHRRTHFGKPRAALWCKECLRSPFGGPPLSPGASSIAVARKRRGPRFERLFPPRDCCPLRPPPGGSLSQGRGPSRKATAPVWDPVPGGLPGSSDRQVSSCNEGEAGLMPGSVRFSGQGNGEPLQYSCLEHPKDRGARWATVHGIKGRLNLSALTRACSD